MTPTITLSILNSCAAQIPALHDISDAGAGAGLMGYTPACDSEIIACGQPFTRLPGAEKTSAQNSNPRLLANGSVSPAILTHGLLQLFRSHGYRVRLRCYNLGLDVVPQWPQADIRLDSAESYSCQADQLDEFIARTLLPHLAQQSAAQDITLLAECGVGGTLFANLWLRFLLDTDLLLRGSTQDEKKLRRKAVLLNDLQQRSVQRFGDGAAPEQWLADPQFHDPIQRALTQVLRYWQSRPELPRLQLAGGMMMLAPALALLQRGELSRERLEVMTTRWIRPPTEQGQALTVQLQQQFALHLHQTPFNLARQPAVRAYERGLVVEGCGLGGCLVLAERLGISAQQIITAMDSAVTDYLA